MRELTLDARLDRAGEVIRRPAFRQNRGLGNEVGYYIFDYAPEDELAVRAWVDSTRARYEGGPDGFSVVVFDIYDIMIDFLESSGYLEKCYEFEQKRGFERITRAVGNALRLTSAESHIVKHICGNTPESCVVFITGIGKSYPIVRSHTILNNLHQVLDSVPVVMFYPGRYDGQELILFDEIKDDNYYRAFRLVD